MTVNFVGNDANGMVSYHADVLTKVSDLLKSSPSDMAARAALQAWANDLRAMGKLGPDEREALDAVAKAAANGDFSRAQKILDGKPALTRFLSGQVAVITSWTNTENGQNKEHHGGGWIVLPEGYAAPPPDAPAVFLPPGSDVIRAGGLQGGEPEAAVLAQRAHLPRHPGPKPASIDPWQAFERPADCAGRKPAGTDSFHTALMTDGPPAMTEQQLRDFVDAPPRALPPRSSTLPGAARQQYETQKTAGAHASHLPPAKDLPLSQRFAGIVPEMSRAQMAAWLQEQRAETEARTRLEQQQPERFTRNLDADLKRIEGNLQISHDAAQKFLSEWQVIRHVADWTAGATPPSMEIWNEPAQLIAAARAALSGGPGEATLPVTPEVRAARLEQAYQLMQKAGESLRSAQWHWRHYTERNLEGAQTTLERAEAVRDGSKYTLFALGVAASGGTALLVTGLSVGLDLTDAALRAASGEKVDWTKVALETAATIIATKWGGKLSKGLMKYLLNDPALKNVPPALLEKTVENILVGAESRALTTAITHVREEARGEMTGEEFADALLDPKAMLIDSLLPAVHARLIPSARQSAGSKQPVPAEKQAVPVTKQTTAASGPEGHTGDSNAQAPGWQLQQLDHFSSAPPANDVVLEPEPVAQRQILQPTGTEDGSARNRPGLTLVRGGPGPAADAPNWERPVASAGTPPSSPRGGGPGGRSGGEPPSSGAFSSGAGVRPPSSKGEILSPPSLSPPGASLRSSEIRSAGRQTQIEVAKAEVSARYQEFTKADQEIKTFLQGPGKLRTETTAEFVEIYVARERATLEIEAARLKWEAGIAKVSAAKAREKALEAEKQGKSDDVAKWNQTADAEEAEAASAEGEARNSEALLPQRLAAAESKAKEVAQKIAARWQTPEFRQLAARAQRLDELAQQAENAAFHSTIPEMHRAAREMRDMANRANAELAEAAGVEVETTKVITQAPPRPR